MPQQTTEVGCNFVDGDLFKATLLWDKIVTHLETSVKCGRHTQALRSYANCFQGSKAVDCLLVYLNSVLSKTVQRHQVQTLCNKLVLTGVVEDVKDKEKGVFREGRLYRLTKNHFWANPAERKLPRTRSAEEICTTEKESDMDEKGYASDSTVGASNQEQSPSISHKKKKSTKDRDRESHHLKDYKISHSTGSRLVPSNSGLLRMKSTGSIFNTPDCTPASALCESRESLLLDTKHRRRHTHRRPSRLDIGHNNALLSTRRASVDSGATRGLPSSKPPLHARKSSKSRDESRQSGKERPAKTRLLSRSLKGESERSPGTIYECDFPGMKGSSRSMSCSSMGDYDGSSASPATAASTPTSPLATPPSASSKWIVYGFL